MFNWSSLTNLILPAVILSAVPFFIKFFGKAVADQAPFADDRDWKVELEGLLFCNSYVISPIIGTYIIVANGFNLFKFTSNDWLLLLSTAFVSIGLYFVQKKARRFFYENTFKTMPLTYLMQTCWLCLISYALIVLAYFYYQWGAIIYILPLAIYFLMHSVGFALFTSLHSKNILISDIIFNDKRHKPIKQCRILKVNKDTIRFIKGNQIHLVEKAQVFEIVTKRDSVHSAKKKSP